MALQQVALRSVCHLLLKAVALAVMMSTPSTADLGSVSDLSQGPSVATAPGSGSVPDSAVAAEPTDEACRRFVEKGLTIQWFSFFFTLQMVVTVIFTRHDVIALIPLRSDFLKRLGMGYVEVCLIRLEMMFWGTRTTRTGGDGERPPEWWPTGLQCQTSHRRINYYGRRGVAVKVESEVNAAVDLLENAYFAFVGLVLCNEVTISWLAVYLHLSTEYDCGWVMHMVSIGGAIRHFGLGGLSFVVLIGYFAFRYGHIWHALARVQSGATRVIAKKEAKRRAVARDASGQSNGVEPAGLHLPQLSSEEEVSLLVGKGTVFSGPSDANFNDVELDEETARPSSLSNHDDTVSKLIPYTLQVGLLLFVMQLAFGSNAMDQGFAGNMLALAAPATVAVLGYSVGYVFAGLWAGALVIRRYSFACQRSTYLDKRWLDEVSNVRLNALIVAEPEALVDVANNSVQHDRAS